MIGAVCATATVGLRGFLLPSIRGRDLLQVAVLVNSLTIFILKSRTHLSIFCITINIVTKDYQNEDWVSVYQSALTELEDAKMSGRIEAAQTAILARIEKLHALPDLHPKERQAIEDAMRGLRFLEREEVRHNEQHKRLAIERSLEKLRSIGPTIQRLSDRVDPE
jgi:hypothetical protein